MVETEKKRDVLLTIWLVIILIANSLSTFTAMTLSYVLNSGFVFSAKRTKRNLVAFFVVTLVGLWVVQNAVLYFLVNSNDLFQDNIIMTNLAKVLATTVSMTWNFLLYKFIVFKTNNESKVNTSPRDSQNKS